MTTSATAIEIRSPGVDELPAFRRRIQAGFHMPPDPEDVRAYRDERFAADVDLARTRAAFERDAVVATFRSFATPLTVAPGVEVPADAISHVTVAPTHRRRGLLAQMMAADLREATARGDAAAILIASEATIYGRFGFAPASELARWQIDRAAVRWAIPPAGAVEEVARADLLELGPAVWERVRRATPGAIERSETYWREVSGVAPGDDTPAARVAIVRDDDGEPAGYVRFHVDPVWDQMRPDGKLHVADLQAVTPEGEARLWRFCCEVDLVTRIEASDRRVDEPVRHRLGDMRAMRELARFDFLWARLLDVAVALGARVAAAPPGAQPVVVEVADEGGPAGGRFAVEPGGCAATDAAADLALDVTTLSCAWLGGTSVAALQAAGRVDERRDGAVAALDALLHAPLAPWSATMF